MSKNKPENLKKAQENFKKNHPEIKQLKFDIHVDIREKFSNKAKELGISKAELFRDTTEKLCNGVFLNQEQFLLLQKIIEKLKGNKHFSDLENEILNLSKAQLFRDIVEKL